MAKSGKGEGLGRCSAERRDPLDVGAKCCPDIHSSSSAGLIQWTCLRHCLRRESTEFCEGGSGVATNILRNHVAVHAVCFDANHTTSMSPRQHEVLLRRLARLYFKFLLLVMPQIVLLSAALLPIRPPQSIYGQDSLRSSSMTSFRQTLCIGRWRPWHDRTPSSNSTRCVLTSKMRGVEAVTAAY